MCVCIRMNVYVWLHQTNHRHVFLFPLQANEDFPHFRIAKENMKRKRWKKGKGRICERSKRKMKNKLRTNKNGFSSIWFM